MGWYSSPAVGDLDAHGTLEVVGATYSLFVVNGEAGSEQWSVDPPGTVTLPTGLTYPLPDETLVKLYEPGGRLHVLDQARNAVRWRRQLALDTGRLAC